MSQATPPSVGAKGSRLNVLLLDGGGVRGLSSLLLLQALMLCINMCIKSSVPDSPDLQPQDIFDLVAGTSTGGLIALMLGKMGMTVAECIKQYEDLSKEIFGKSHIRATLTMRLGHAKYSGKRLRNCVRGLLKKRNLAEDHMMKHIDPVHDRVPCAVVCREHLSPSRYSKLQNKSVCICSRYCGEETVVCKVCDAARATSAAPTYFPVAKIEEEGGSKRYFSDGGFENNNPTLSIIQHYVAYKRAEGAAPYVDTPQNARHGDLDFDRVRYVNIGTGTKTDALARHRDSVASLLPGFIRMGIFLKETLTEIAVSAERDAAALRIMAQTSSDKMKYERYSADNGVCFIKLYKYKELPEIVRLTETYLEKDSVKKEMQRVASEIATEYLASQRTKRNAVGQSAEPSSPTAEATGTTFEPSMLSPRTPPANLTTEESKSTQPKTPTLSSNSSEIKNEQLSNTPSTAKSLHEADSPAADLMAIRQAAESLVTTRPTAAPPPILHTAAMAPPDTIKNQVVVLS